jgi:hypothetical protein
MCYFKRKKHIKEKDFNLKILSCFLSLEYVFFSLECRLYSDKVEADYLPGIL